MGVTQQNGLVKNYEVTKKVGEGDSEYELLEVDVESDETNPVNNTGRLGTARLLSILAEAHSHTRFRKFADDAFA